MTILEKQRKATLEDVEKNSVEIIANRLYFTHFDGQPPINETIYTFSTEIDYRLTYENFCLDFGPLNLAQTYRFCEILKSILNNEELKEKKIYFHCSNDRQQLANCAALVAAYNILENDKSVEDALLPFVSKEKLFEPFHDASYFPCDYNLTVRDCMSGLSKAKELGFFDWDKFDVSEYEHYIDLDNGDLNWLVEGKFAAFAGPFEKRKHFGNNYYSTIPSDYVPYFKEKNVTAVIRLNQAFYSSKHFQKEGINHYSLYYEDGANPPEEILQKFIKICEKEKGAIAVHCKAGLGRTGTCIGMYLLKHFDISARELIGWFRIARPGTVIGPQQQYLEENEARIKQAGIEFRKAAVQKSSSLNNSLKRQSSTAKDVSRSSMELSLVKTENISKARAKKKLGKPNRFQSFDMFEGSLETQGDKLNKLKAEHKLKESKEKKEDKTESESAE